MIITDKNIRNKLSFIIGSEELSDNELYIIYQNLNSIFGSNLEHLNNKTVFVASKNYLKYQNFKMQYFCCGCAEFKIPINEGFIFLAIDY